MKRKKLKRFYGEDLIFVGKVNGIAHKHSKMCINNVFVIKESMEGNASKIDHCWTNLPHEKIKKGDVVICTGRVCCYEHNFKSLPSAAVDLSLQLETVIEIDNTLTPLMSENDPNRFFDKMLNVN